MDSFSTSTISISFRPDYIAYNKIEFSSKSRLINDVELKMPKLHERVAIIIEVLVNRINRESL